MRTSWIVATIACTALSASAQTPTPSQRPAQPVGNRGGNQTVNVTGCVSKGHAEGGGLADFVLMNARMSNDSPTGTAQPSPEDPRNTPGGGEATKNSNAGNLRFVLDSNGTDLASHVGHRVELSGRIVPPTGTPPSAGLKSGNANQAVPTASPVDQRFRVQSVKLIADTCDVP